MKHKLIIIKIILLFLLFSILIKPPLYASKPIAGVAVVRPGSLKVMNISAQLETQLINVINSAGVFNILNPDLLKDQLKRFECLEEDCVLAFARTASINIIIRADVEDKGSSIIFNIYSHGIGAPYFGRVVYKYRAEIPVAGLSLSQREYNYIAEEHAAYFMSGLLRRYKAQFFIKHINKNPVIDSDENISGVFDLYRYESSPPSGEKIRLIRIIGEVNVDKKEVRIISPGKILPEDNDFIFISFIKKAEFIDNLIYGRKRELVIREPSSSDTAVLFFSTVPISALMPLIAPIGYYKSGDFTGLLLWAANTLPYLYIEYNGMTNRPDSYKDDRKDVSRQTLTRYRFGLYMLFCGGIPLVIDAFSSQSLYLASGYQGTQSYLGNTFSAVYLSLISGGGGMFYRGYRLEGYLYFHLHNILLYSAIKEFSAGETYDAATNSYKKESRNKKRAYSYLGALGLLKIIEVTHVILVKDNIKSGKIHEENYGFEPAVYPDSSGINFGMQYSVKY